VPIDIRILAIAVLAALASAEPVEAQVRNGFDLSDALIPVREIRAGGPPRDGIPALTDPSRETVDEAERWLVGKDRVLGLVIDGEAVAYPIRILNWHEVVNDVVAGRAVAVTYCPLCGTGVVFDATLARGRVNFGISGLLYNSDVLLFDRRTESLFSQLMLKAVSGPLSGTELTPLPSQLTTWENWRARQPDTSVLSVATGHVRDYNTDPYRRYRKSSRTLFPVRDADPTRKPKEWAWLVLTGDETRSFRTAEGVQLSYDPLARELSAPAGPGEHRIVIPGYWFALTAFYPDAHRTELGDLAENP